MSHPHLQWVGHLADYQPLLRLLEFKQSQMNLALLHAMIAGGVSVNFIETCHFQEFHEARKTKLQYSKLKAYDRPLSCSTLFGSNGKMR